MGKTLRKDKNGKTYNESSYKKEAHYRCRCEYCLGKKDTADKLTEKKLKTEMKNMENRKVPRGTIRKSNQIMINKSIVDNHYKTVHENKQELNQFFVSKQEKDFNIGTVEERVEWLPRFTPLSDGQMLEELEGEYVLVSSVLNLFSAQK